MILNQLSVFLENKPGMLSAFINTLAENNVDLQALSIADSRDYGVLRIIVDDPSRVAGMLITKDWPCTVTPVLAVTVPDEPGSLTHILSVLADGGVSLSYSYAFFSREKGRAVIVLRVEDNEKAIDLLEKAGISAK